MGQCQREHEDRLREQGKQIVTLQGDIEVYKKSIADKSEEGIRVYEHITQLKRQIDERCSDIAHTNNDLEGVRLHNDALRRDIEQLHHETAHAQDVKKRQQQANFVAKNDLRTREKEVEDQKLRLSVLEKEERNAQERIRGLTDQVDQRTYNIDKTNGKLDTVLKECE